MNDLKCLLDDFLKLILYLKLVSNGYAASIIHLLIICVCLTSCDFTSREQHIETYGKRIGEDGYMTEDAYIIEWPAVTKQYTHETVHAPALKLKIGKEWLSSNPYHKSKLNGTNDIDKLYVISQVPGPIPWRKPNFSKDSLVEVLLLSDEERAKRTVVYAEAVRNSTFISIHRGTTTDLLFTMNGGLFAKQCEGLAVGELRADPNKLNGHGCFREDDLDGLERYVATRCLSNKEIQRRKQMKNSGGVVKSLANKASDDPTPENCYLFRGNQYFKTTANTPPDERVLIRCGTVTCEAEFPLKNRTVEVVIESIYSRNTYYSWPQDAKAPMRDEVFPELLRWREKVDVAKALVNSFVVD